MEPTRFYIELNQNEPEMLWHWRLYYVYPNGRIRTLRIGKHHDPVIACQAAYTEELYWLAGAYSEI